MENSGKSRLLLFSNIYRLCERIYEYASDGGKRTFVFLIATGFLIYGLLFVTVHNRTEADLTKNTPARYNLLIQFWKDHGYFKHGGLWVWSAEKGADYWNPPKDDEPVKYIYRSYPMGHIMFANIAERMCINTTGKFSYSLMRFHNQFFVLISSALLGLIAYRFGRKTDLSPFSTMLLALSCQIIYQTFPVNLFYFWEVYPSTIAIPFILVFILMLEDIYHKNNPHWKKVMTAAVCGFFAFYIDPPVAGFFFIFLMLNWLILGNRDSLKNNWYKITLYPAVLAIVVIMSQLIIAKTNFPNVEMLGSDFWFRTGLDGSTLYYKDHSALFNKREQFGFLNWRFLFFGGASGLAVFMFGFHKYIRDNYIAMVISSLLCLYFPVAFAISQGVIIHPYYFDAYLAIVMILILFCVLPILLEKMTGKWGGFIILFTTFAFCYTFVQLRAFMVAYPR